MIENAITSSRPKLQSSFVAGIYMLAPWIAIALAISIPLSTSLTTISGVSLAACGLLTFNHRIFSNKLGLAILLLVMWYGFSALHSIGEQHTISQTLHKMARLLLIPIFASFLLKETLRRNILFGFVIASTIAVAAACWRHNVVFKDNILTSLFTAYAIFILAHLCFEYRRWAWLLFLPCAIFLTYYLLFIGTGRSGQIIFFILALLFAWQRLRHNLWLKITAAVSLFAVITAIILVPNSFIKRQSIALNEMKNYSVQHEDQVPHTSSMGTRFILAHNSWELIKQRPILGWGTGGFTAAYAAYAPEGDEGHDKRTNPHNQFLSAWVETGVIGLIMLCGFFAVLLNMFWSQASLEGYLGVGLILTYLAGCLVNSWLLDCATAYFFVLIAALCLAGRSINTYKTTLDAAQKPLAF